MFCNKAGNILIRAAIGAACVFFLCGVISGRAYCEVTGTAEESEPIASYGPDISGSSDSSPEGGSDSRSSIVKEPEGKDEYSSATSTNPFVVPAATWVTPDCKHGENVFVVLPIVNMFKYNIKDVVVTPVLSAKTDEFPFEIDATGFTQKIDVLLGEDAEPDRNKRAQNCVWAFRTRDNVKTGYYKLDYTVTYTNPACVIETCTISTYVRTIGIPKNGTTDGYEENKKISTPRVIVTGFTTEPKEVKAGGSFVLNVTVKNTSTVTSVNNMELTLTGNVEGNDKTASYAAFLPASGSNSFYIDTIGAQKEKVLSMEFSVKADLEQKPYVMDIKMKYEDDEANPFEGDANLSIPVHQEARFDTGAAEVQPSYINVGDQANLMFSIYNTGKTRLYNVQVTVDDPSLEEALAYVGSINPGETGNVDVMLTGRAPSEGDGTVKCIISYEDESGNVTKSEKEINLPVMEAVEEDIDFEGMDEPGEEDSSMMLKRAAAAAGALVILLVVIVLILRVRAEHKKRKEEKELLTEIPEEEETENEDS